MTPQERALGARINRLLWIIEASNKIIDPMLDAFRQYPFDPPYDYGDFANWEQAWCFSDHEDFDPVWDEETGEYLK